MPKETIAEAVWPVIASMIVWSGMGFVLPLYLVAYGMISVTEFLVYLSLAGVAVAALFWFWIFQLGRKLAKTDLVPITQKQLTVMVEVLVGIFAVGGTLVALSSYVSPPYTLATCVKPPTVNVTSPNCQQIKTVSVTNPGPSGIGEIGYWIIQLGLTAIWTFILVYAAVSLIQWIAKSEFVRKRFRSELDRGPHQ